jgi:hypothetical protein
VKGTFRWSGTTTLIFTPDQPLPYATEYGHDRKSAKSVAGNTLDQPYRWSFTTPTIRLMRTDWYRKKNGAVVIALRFNQPVDATTLAPHLKLQTQAHNIELPPVPPSGEAKKAKALAAAASDGEAILSFIATDWDKERFAPGKDLVVLETKPGIAPDTAIQVLIDDQLAPSPRQARGREQTFVIELEPTLFVTNMDCIKECDPEQRNAINFRSGPGLMFAEVQKAVSVSDVTDPAKPVALKPKEPKPSTTIHRGDTVSMSWATRFSPATNTRFASRIHSKPSTASNSVTSGPRTSTTGIAPHSSASAPATASGNRAAVPCCRSTRATSRA